MDSPKAHRETSGGPYCGLGSATHNSHFAVHVLGGELCVGPQGGEQAECRNALAASSDFLDSNPFLGLLIGCSWAAV